MSHNDLWTNKIRAFLHDPPDKAFELRNHVWRRMQVLGDLKFYADHPLPPNTTNIKKELKKNWWRYQEKRLKIEGRSIYDEFGDLPSIPEIHTADLSASSLQRIDLEKSKERRKLTSTFDKLHTKEYEYIGYPVIRHPVTGEIREFCAITEYLPKVDKPVVDQNDPEKDSYENEFRRLLNRILEVEKKTFSKLVKSDGDKDDYLRVWTFYGEELKNALKSEFSELFAEEFVNLPAYTLSPDHTLFDHADATSAIYGAECNGRKPLLVLSKLNPVQKFIADARKEKDLWAASHILSVLNFSAISVIVEKFGPDAVIYPHLRGNPFLHAWLFSHGIENSKPNSKYLSIASIPNKFFALIGADSDNEIEELEKEIKGVIDETLEKLFDLAWDKLWNVVIESSILTEIKRGVSEKLKEEIKKCRDEKRKRHLENELKEILEYPENKKELHKEILLSHFNVTLSHLKIPEIDLPGNKEEAYTKLKNFVKSLKLPEDVEKKYLGWLGMLESVEASDNRPSKYDLYSLYYEILLELNAIESAEFTKPEEPAGFKCTLCGEHLAIGGESEKLMKALWERVHRKLPEYVRKNEHLCAVCLVKRFYPEFIKELEIFRKIKPEIPRTESVSEVAMCKKTKAKISWKDIYDFLKDYKSLEELKASIGVEKPEGFAVKLSELKKAIGELIEHIVDQTRQQRIYSDGFLDKLHRNFSNEVLYIENLRDSKSLLDTIGFGVSKDVDIDENLLSKVRNKLSEIYKQTGKPPKYYAILVMDGDEMGRLLSGDKLQVTAKYLHPKVLDRIRDKLKAEAGATRRLITPAAHAAISRAVKNFAVNHVPGIVESNRGSLIYAGGDDILALLPVDTALDAAAKLAEMFSKSWNGWEILPGGTISAGIVIVHYKHPLYDALERARAMLEKAKKLGRNAVAVGFLKRSGSYYEAVVNYETVGYAKAIASLIMEDRVSSRALYDLMSTLESLPGENELMQIVKYETTRHAKSENDARTFTSLLRNGVKGVRVEFEKADGISDVAKFQELVNELVRDGRVNELRKLSDLCGREAIRDRVIKKQAIGFLSLVKIIFDAERGDER